MADIESDVSETDILISLAVFFGIIALDTLEFNVVGHRGDRPIIENGHGKVLASVVLMKASGGLSSGVLPGESGVDEVLSLQSPIGMDVCTERLRLLVERPLTKRSIQFFHPRL